MHTHLRVRLEVWTIIKTFLFLFLFFFSASFSISARVFRTLREFEHLQIVFWISQNPGKYIILYSDVKNIIRQGFRHGYVLWHSWLCSFILKLNNLNIIYNLCSLFCIIFNTKFTRLFSRHCIYNIHCNAYIIVHVNIFCMYVYSSRHVQVSSYQFLLFSNRNSSKNGSISIQLKM